MRIAGLAFGSYPGGIPAALDHLADQDSAAAIGCALADSAGTLPAGLAAVVFVPAWQVFGPLGFWEYFHVLIFHVALSLAYIVAYSAIEGRSPSMALLVYVADAAGAGPHSGGTRVGAPRRKSRGGAVAGHAAGQDGGPERRPFRSHGQGLGLGAKPGGVSRISGHGKGGLSRHVANLRPLGDAPLLGLASYCVSHLLVSRLVRNRGHYYPLMIGCGCGLAATLVVSAAALAFMQASVPDFAALLGMNLVAYLAFSFGYFNFINLNIASLRIRMVQELAESGGEMPVEALTDLYNIEEVIALRIDRLSSGGHLIERQGRFYSGKRQFLIVGRIFDFLRLVILGSRLPLGRSYAGPRAESRFPRGLHERLPDRNGRGMRSFAVRGLLQRRGRDSSHAGNGAGGLARGRLQLRYRDRRRRLEGPFGAVDQAVHGRTSARFP